MAGKGVVAVEMQKNGHSSGKCFLSTSCMLVLRDLAATVSALASAHSSVDKHTRQTGKGMKTSTALGRGSNGECAFTEGGQESPLMM